jgi:hypothetical protein
VSEGEEVATVARVDIDDEDDGDIEGSDEETNEETNEETIETIEENEPVDEKDE